MSFDLTQKIKVVNPTSNIDELYGTYNSVAEALTGVPSVLRMKGRTVGIIENGSVVEYWFKDGIADTDLVVKSSSEDTLDDVAKRGSNSTVPISAGLNTAKLFTHPVSANMGYGNINSAVTGVWNTYFGLNALQNVTTGYSNIAFGGASLQSTTTGKENQAFGSNALASNTTGSFNNGFGSQAGRYMVSSYNDSFG